MWSTLDDIEVGQRRADENDVEEDGHEHPKDQVGLETNRHVLFLSLCAIVIAGVWVVVNPLEQRHVSVDVDAQVL